MNDLRWILAHLRGVRRYAVLVLLAAAGASALSAVDPLLMKALIDDALAQGNARYAVELSAAIACCFLLRTVVGGLGNILALSMSQTSTNNLRIDLLEKFNVLSADYHEQVATGEKITNFDRDIVEVASFGSDSLAQVFRAGLLFAINLAVMARLNGRLTLAIIPSVPLFIWIQKRFRKQLRDRADRTRDQIGASTADLTEYLGAVPQVQLLGAQMYGLERAKSAWNSIVTAQRSQRVSEVQFSVAASCVLVLSILTILIGGSALVIRDALTIGTLVAFYAYIGRIFDPISFAMDFYARIQSVAASIRRLRAVFNAPASVADLGRRSLQSIERGVEIRNVSCVLSGREVLERVSFSVRSGERIALIGETGCGKTTLAKLLVRLRDAESGTILIDDTPLDEFTLESLRTVVSYVPQQPILFRGTVRDNILLGADETSEEQLQRVVGITQLEPTLRRFPEELLAEVGPGGGFLSGGERQRVAIARALLRAPQLLILDESTSALDLGTERRVYEALDSSLANGTLIVISHRVNSLAWMDRLMIMEKGQIVESGSHQQLFQRSDRYRAMFFAAELEEGEVGLYKGRIEFSPIRTPL